MGIFESIKDAVSYDYYEFKVAGVSFSNDGKLRQTILRKIFFKDPPFDGDLDIRITEYNFNGEMALGVYVNDEQIGNVPRDSIQYIAENAEKFEDIYKIDVYGGGHKENGEELNFGSKLILKFRRK